MEFIFKWDGEEKVNKILKREKYGILDDDECYGETESREGNWKVRGAW